MCGLCSLTRKEPATHSLDQGTTQTFKSYYQKRIAQRPLVNLPLTWELETALLRGLVNDQQLAARTSRRPLRCVQTETPWHERLQNTNTDGVVAQTNRDDSPWQAEKEMKIDLREQNRGRQGRNKPWLRQTFHVCAATFRQASVVLMATCKQSNISNVLQ